MNDELTLIYDRGRTSKHPVKGRDFAEVLAAWRRERWLRASMRRGFALQTSNGQVARGYQRP